MSSIQISDHHPQVETGYSTYSVTPYNQALEETISRRAFGYSVTFSRQVVLTRNTAKETIWNTQDETRITVSYFLTVTALCGMTNDKEYLEVSFIRYFIWDCDFPMKSNGLLIYMVNTKLMLSQNVTTESHLTGSKHESRTLSENTWKSNYFHIQQNIYIHCILLKNRFLTILWVHESHKRCVDLEGVAPKQLMEWLTEINSEQMVTRNLASFSATKIFPLRKQLP